MATLKASKVERLSKRKLTTLRANGGSSSARDPKSSHEEYRTIVLGLLLGALTLLLYSPAGTHPFLNYDDPSYVTENSHVQAGLSWGTVVWAFQSTEASNWHPITWLSHAADVSLFGASPCGHHWTSVLIHGLNAVLFFLLLRYATGAIWQSLIAAVLFAVHPLNVESVAWISERKNVLSALFLLLTLGAYGWYALRPRATRYGVVIALFALGLMTKPMLVTLPFALLLIDYWPLQRIRPASLRSEPARFRPESISRLMIEKLPLLAMSAASAAITVIAQQASLAPAQRFPSALRLENAIYSCGMYLAKAVWPASLALFYPYPTALSPLRWMGTAAVLLAVSVMVWKQSSRPYVLVGWCWFLGTLVPVLGIVQVGAQAMADRYAYVPLMGTFVAVVWWAWAVTGKGMRITAISVCLLSLLLLTVRQLGYWRTNYDLWTHTLAVTHDNLVAEDKLGSVLQQMGRQDEAMIHFGNAERLDSLDPLSNFSLGADLQWRGHLREAIPRYETAIRQTTDARLQADSYQNLGTDYMQLGDEKLARENFLLALRANPGLLTVFAGLGELAGEPARTLSQSVLQNPTREGFLRLATAFQESGRFEESGLAYAVANTKNAPASAGSM